jgi:hypothetical protein
MMWVLYLWFAGVEPAGVIVTASVWEVLFYHKEAQKTLGNDAVASV